jgi:hypothetical protein
MMSTHTNCHYILDTGNLHPTCSRRPGPSPPALPREGHPTDIPRERWRPWCAPDGHVGAYAVPVGRGSLRPQQIGGAPRTCWCPRCPALERLRIVNKSATWLAVLVQTSAPGVSCRAHSPPHTGPLPRALTRALTPQEVSSRCAFPFCYPLVSIFI